MTSPLTLFPDGCAIMPPQYMASAAYYAVMAAYGRVVIDSSMRYDKRFKSAHRCDIASTHGLLRLTVPIEKASLSGRGWDSVGVSDHGDWWSDHIVSLESAYGRTPFFEYYFDRIRPWLSRPKGITVGALDAALDRELRAILHLPAQVTYDLADAPADAVDYRRGLPALPAVPYYQVRAARLGFIPGLSVIDLICNMGPESPLILKSMAATLTM